MDDPLTAWLVWNSVSGAETNGIARPLVLRNVVLVP